MSVNSDFNFPVSRKPKTIQVTNEKNVYEVSTEFTFQQILDRLKGEFPLIPDDAKIKVTVLISDPNTFVGVQVYWYEDKE